MNPNVTVPGASGTRYIYTAYSPAGTWTGVPGNYLFAHWGLRGWNILYVGQCDSFQNRIPSHERWAEAVRRGATHVLAHTNQNGEAARKAEEQDIIASHQPPMNTHHKAA